MIHPTRIIISLLLIVLTASCSQAQDANTRVSQHLGEANWFALEREMRSTARDSLAPVLRDMADALVCHYFNRPTEAVKQLRRLVEHRLGELGPENAFNMSALIPLNLARQGRYSEAARTAQSIAAQARRAADSTDVARQLRSLAAKLDHMASYYGAIGAVGDICRPAYDTSDDQRVAFFFDASVHRKGQGAFLAMNGMINGHPVTVNLDTGAGMNFLSSADADRLGLIRLNSYIDAQGTGAQRAQIAVADTLQLGRGMAWTNVVFLVLDVSTGDSLTDSRLSAHMAPTIGVPMMRAMGEMRISFADKVIYIPAKSTTPKDAEPNMYITDSETINLQAADQQSGQPLTMHFDTGAWQLMFTPSWYRQHRAETEQKGVADSLRLGGVGGSVMQHAWLLPHCAVAVGGSTLNAPAMVATGTDLHTAQHIDEGVLFAPGLQGVIGLEPLASCREAVVNMRRMRLTVK